MPNHSERKVQAEQNVPQQPTIGLGLLQLENYCQGNH